MSVDYSLLETYTTKELDDLNQKMGTWPYWCRTGARHLFYQREQRELNIVMNLIDNRWGLPIISKAAKEIQEDRGEVSASLEHDREIHDPKEILWSNKETD